MIRLTFYTTFLFLSIAAGSFKVKTKVVNLIIYTDFLYPQRTYDSLRAHFIKSGLVDSLKIIGMPIEIPSLYFEIDSVSVHQYGISLNTLQSKIKELEKIQSVNKIREQFMVNNVGDQVPIGFFIRVYNKVALYEPEIFVANPKTYFHLDRRAVKIEFYCKKSNFKKLISLIHQNIQNYSDKYDNSSIEYEIIKDKYKN